MRISEKMDSKTCSSVNAPSGEMVWEIVQEWSGDRLILPAGHNLAASWSLLLFADGSPTRQLAVLTSSKFRVDILSASELATRGIDMPAEAEELGFPCIRREVWLENERGDRLGHAVSWWRPSDLQTLMPDPSQPIGGSMATTKLEVHRQPLRVHCGYNAALEQGLLKSDGPLASPSLLWSRTYRMWHGGRPVTIITETFSPALEKWLGPTYASPDAARPS